MAFLVGGANSAVADTGIANSLRSNQADGAYLSFAVSSPNTDIFTMSLWVKTCLIASGSQTFCEIGKSLTGEAGDYTTFAAHFDVDGRSSFDSYDGVNNAYIIRWGAPPTAVFRDPSAWYHIVCRMDSSQGTLANRARIYVNGEDFSSYLTHTTDPSQNDDYFHGTGSSVYFPGGANTGGGKWNGYIAEAAYIDGTSYAPGTFAETDEDSGIWKPKDFKGDVTFGTNGLYLEFKQSGTGTNSSGLGADTSGNDNHMAVTNFAATDQCTDTPTNNFATLNPLSNNNATLSEGNTQVIRASDANLTIISNIAPTKGKWYFEFKQSGTQNVQVGITNLDNYASGTDLENEGGGSDNVTANVWIEDGATYVLTYAEDYGDQTNIVSGDRTTQIHGFALDIDNNDLYVSANGSWYGGSSFNQADFANATALITDLPSGVPLAVSIRGNLASSVYINFGNPPASISSSNTDGSYGNFEYAVPTDYYAICTKRLAEFG